MEIDIRNGQPTVVDSVRFSADQVVVGADANVALGIRRDGQQVRALCNKADVPDLIKALQAALKLWA
jgi:hypothetical protein